MIIIEAGATSTKVCLIEDQKIGEVKLYQGINPNYMSDDAISLILRDCLDQTAANTMVYYYGTGCASIEVQARMKAIISKQFGIKNISVHSDLLGSARAIAKTKSGQINILGTGSASCVYDGEGITNILPNVGYLFGDHGSGYKLGYSLLQAYFDDLLAEEIQHEIEAYCKMKKSEVLKYIYQEDSKSKIVAFAKCMHHIKHHAAINHLILTEFDAFITKQIKRNPEYLHTDQYFTGSIASYFKFELETSLQKYDLSIKKICKNPIEELCAFHLTYNQ